jgi:hypothetical protein
VGRGIAGNKSTLIERVVAEPRAVASFERQVQEYAESLSPEQADDMFAVDNVSADEEDEHLAEQGEMDEQ